MPEPTRICIVTGTRADFGHLSPLIAAIGKAEDMQPQIIAAASHLVSVFGRTKDEIKAKGYKIDREVDLLLANDAPAAIARSAGLGLMGFASALEDLDPDLVVILGDRFEALSAAAAATLMGIPIAHLHGGERTLGAVDESLRHALTKLSRLHFVAAEPYRRRVIQMGEHPSTVFNVGALGLEALDQTAPMTRDEVAAAIGLELTSPVLLVTYHPPTTDIDPTRGLKALLGALAALPEARIVFTGVNADAGHHAIRGHIAQFVKERPGRAVFHPSLGHVLYINMMRQADVVVGNSSSGVIEAAYLRKPSVDIGHRQEGRLKARSVLGCAEDERAIGTAIEQALSNDFRSSLVSMELHYQGGPVSERILTAIRALLPGLGPQKAFHDLTCA
jgi:UDP-N-acetylglucosamine 2-epimerase (non-hydrolysing)